MSCTPKQCGDCRLTKYLNPINGLCTQHGVTSMKTLLDQAIEQTDENMTPQLR